MWKSSTMVETLRWCDGHLEMLDQRLLPSEAIFIAYDSAADVAGGIRDMVVRGAPAIGCAAAFGIALEAQRCKHLSEDNFTLGMEDAFSILATSRPTAVNLFWALDRMRRSWERCDHNEHHKTAEFLLQEAQDVLVEDIRINRDMGEWGSELLKDGYCVLTHCNAGALATAGHGTALGVIRSAVQAGKKISVIADETRPYLQGARLTAWEMVQENIPVTLICDNMAGHMMAKGKVDVVIVGADRVAANGDVANKIGTYMVAVLAARHNIPFYVACPLSTIDISLADGSDIPIEERGAVEVRGFRDCIWTPERAKICNPSFDVTPVELVTALITEKGVVLSPDAEKIRALFAV